MPGDEYLDRRMERYERWISQGRIPSSSKVIPVWRSVSVLQWILPTEQVLEMLRNSRSYALGACSCRTRYGRCDNPLEVCFFLNDMADSMVSRGEARRVWLDEASARAELANEHGLVHLSIYNPGQHVYALCSCCPCCCHDLQFLLRYGRSDLIARSQYVSVTREDACVHCGECVARCVFGGRAMLGGRMVYDPGRCWGCGLCVSSCPVDAVGMTLRR